MLATEGIAVVGIAAMLLITDDRSEVGTETDAADRTAETDSPAPTARLILGSAILATETEGSATDAVVKPDTTEATGDAITLELLVC